VEIFPRAVRVKYISSVLIFVDAEHPCLEENNKEHPLLG